MGVAHPQVRNYNAVERVAPAVVAAYSLLVLAVLKVYGPNWNGETVPQSSASRRKTLQRKAEGKSTSRRFSKRDVTMLLRNEIERLGIFSCTHAPMDAPKGWVLTPRETFLDR